MTSEEWSVLRRMIHKEVAAAMNVLLMGQSVDSQDKTEGVENYYPGAPNLGQRPKILPYGFSSRAPSGTMSFTGRVGEHPGARAILGHWDGNRPPIDGGECCLYNANGQIIFLKKSGAVIQADTTIIQSDSTIVESDNIQLGSDSSSENLVLGMILQSMLSTLLGDLSTHTHISGVPASPTSPPVTAAVYIGLKASPVDDGGILSDKAFTEK